jgi:nucleotide-binding universal stress UspA family protein
MFKRILVPVDGSHTATLGLAQAVRIAKEQGAKLRVVSVIDDLSVAQSFETGFDARVLFDALTAAGKRAIANALKLAHRHDIKVEKALYETVSGSVADVIVRDARKWKADLIVMGTHGRRGINRMMLGSDAETVLRTAPCPVLMVRSPAKKGGGRKR